jgi:plastocyanin
MCLTTRWAAGVFMALVALLAHAQQGADEENEPKRIVINVIGDDEGWKYIKEGDDDQQPVEVPLGWTVRWQNDDEEMDHTATSKLKTPDGKRIFDTKKIEAQKFKEIVFDEELFKAAGGTSGKDVKLEYYCSYHARQMKGVLVLKSSAQ